MNPPPKLLRKVVDFIDRFAVIGHSEAMRLKQELGRYLKHPRKSPAASAQKRESRANKAVLTSMVRRACLERARGRCECGCGMPFLWEPELDHMFGKRFTSVEECWILRRDHHREKTENYPTRQVWDSRFQTHCATHGFKFRSRAVKTLGLRSRGGRPLRSHPAARPAPPGAR